MAFCFGGVGTAIHVTEPLSAQIEGVAGPTIPISFESAEANTTIAIPKSTFCAFERMDTSCILGPDHENLRVSKEQFIEDEWLGRQAILAISQ